MVRVTAAASCLFLALISLSACSTFQSSDHRKVVCNELKNKLMFSGNTSNTRRADIQYSEALMLQKQYDKNNCDAIS